VKPKVAVIIANFVVDASRVQKVARWVARAGWDVTVIGRSPTSALERFSLGRATVFRVPVHSLSSSEHERSHWRRRGLWYSYEAYDRALDELRPDLIHAFEIQMLGTAIQAKLRAREGGRDLKVIYDAGEHVAGLDFAPPGWRLAMLADEFDYIRQADGVVTITRPLAEELRRRYDLDELPAVVENAPERRPLDVTTDVELSDIRTDCGLGPDEELVVYSGFVTPDRGLSTVVAALPQLPGVHFGLKVSERERYRCADLERQAEDLRVRDRVHLVPYVAAHEVVHYLRTASVGLITSLPTRGDELICHIKYYEYMHAGLPIVTCDMKLQADMTRKLGNGEVFVAGDVDSFVSATRAVLDDRERYACAYTRPDLVEHNSWETHVPALIDLYRKVVGEDIFSGLDGWATGRWSAPQPGSC